MMTLFSLLTVFFTSRASASDHDIQIFFKKSLPTAAIAIVKEVEPGELKTFVDTLDENKVGQIEATNVSKSVTLNCKTDAVNTSCTFTFVDNYPIILINANEQSFLGKDALDNFTGFEVLRKNPGLSLPLTIFKNGNNLELQLGEGAFSVSGARIVNKF